MNKKLLSALLLGALTVTSTGTLVSCKDYDDDISHLQDQVDELTSLKAAKADVESAIANLKTQLEAKVAEANTAVGTEKDRALAAEAALSARLATAESSLTELQNLINNKVDKSEFNTKVQDIYGKLETVQTGLGNALTDITGLKQGLKDEETARKAADTNLQTQIEALQNAQKALEQAGITNSELNDKISTLINNVQTLQNKVGDLDYATLKTEMQTMSNNITKVMDDLNVLTVLVKTALRSIVFQPQSYYYGIEATEISTLDFKKYTTPAAKFDLKEAKGYDDDNRYPTADGSKVLNFTAHYFLNPANADKNTFTNVAVLDGDVDYVNTRASQAGLTVKDWNVENCMLNVNIQANDISKIKSVAADKQVTTFATQVTINQGKNEATAITSDYATLYRTVKKNLKLAHKATEARINPTVKGADACACGATNCDGHLMQTVKEAKNALPQDACVYENGTLDLRSLVATHFTDVDGTEKELANIEDMGLEYKFELTALYFGTNETSESAHGTITDGHTFSAKMPEGQTGDHRGMIGRTPVVRVSLVDKETGAVYDYGYIRIQIVDKTVTPATPADYTVGYNTPAYTYNYECTQPTYAFQTTWKQVEYDLYNQLRLSREEFEAIYGTGNSGEAKPVMNGAECEQYVLGANGYEVATTKYGTVTPMNDVSSEDGTLTSTLKWTMTAAQAYQYFVTEGKKNVTVIVKYKSNNTAKSPDAYVKFTTEDAKVFKPSASIDWSALKNSNYWYAANTSTPGADEMHNNVITPEDNVGGQGNTMVQKLSNVMDGNNIKATSIIKNIKDQTAGKEYAASKLSLDLVFAKANTGKEFKGHSGKTYVLTADGKDLKANVKGQVTKQTIATISSDADVNKQTITYSNASTFAKDLLNYTAHNALNDETIKALITVEAKNQCPLALDLDDNSFTARFLRPINIKGTGKTIEDANTQTMQVINLKDLITFTDWRDAWKSSYATYYGVTKITVAGVANGGFLSSNTAVTTNQNGADFKPLKNINSSLDFVLNENGVNSTITYKNFGSNVQKFQVKIPVVVSYYWGDLTEIITVTVDGTSGNRD